MRKESLVSTNFPLYITFRYTTGISDRLVLSTTTEGKKSAKPVRANNCSKQFFLPSHTNHC